MLPEKNSTNFSIVFNFNLFCIFNVRIYSLNINTPTFVFDECSFGQTNNAILCIN